MLSLEQLECGEREIPGNIEGYDSAVNDVLEKLHGKDSKTI